MRVTLCFGGRELRLHSLTWSIKNELKKQQVWGSCKQKEKGIGPVLILSRFKS